VVKGRAASHVQRRRQGRPAGGGRASRRPPPRGKGPAGDPSAVALTKFPRPITAPSPSRSFHGQSQRRRPHEVSTANRSAVALAKFPRQIAKHNSVQAKIIPHPGTKAEQVARRTKKTQHEQSDRTTKAIKTFFVNFLFNNRTLHGANSYNTQVIIR
jgi:hypothetical protein